MAKSRDDVLKKMLKTPPQPKKATPGKRDAERGKAKAEESSWRRPGLKTKKSDGGRGTK